jgi:hypothetical protein
VQLVLPPEDLVQVGEVLDALGSVRPDDDQLVAFAVGRQPDFASQALLATLVEPDHFRLDYRRQRMEKIVRVPRDSRHLVVMSTAPRALQRVRPALMSIRPYLDR